MVSLIVSTTLAVFGKYLQSWLNTPEVLFQTLNTVMAFGFITLLFALMFKYLPDVKIAWRDVWPGAIGTSALFSLGKIVIGLYLGKQDYDSTFGAASSLIAVLVWVYYLSQILFLGAEFTKIYARHRGVHVQPEPNAQLAT
jgi:membrane protein